MTESETLMKSVVPGDMIIRVSAYDMTVSSVNIDGEFLEPRECHAFDIYHGDYGMYINLITLWLPNGQRITAASRDWKELEAG